MSFFWKVYKCFHRQAENPIVLRPKKLDNEYKKLVMDYMVDCPIEEPLHNKIKKFKIYRNKNRDSTTKSFCFNVLSLYRFSDFCS